MPALQISVDKKIVSVGKKHTKYRIFPINSCKSPHVEIFFHVDLSGKTRASEILQGYSSSETHRPCRAESCRNFVEKDDSKNKAPLA